MLDDGFGGRLGDRGGEVGNGLGNSLTLDRTHRLGLLGGRASVADVTLSLRAVLTDILLDQVGGVRGSLASHVPKLVGLGVDDLLVVDNLLVDEFTVADVDQGGKVCGGHGNQSHAPKGKEAEQPVTGESSKESLSS